jgi:hypothetical protein
MQAPYLACFTERLSHLVENGVKSWKYEFLILKKNYSQVPVAHTHNPSYSGGGDQEDRGLKPAPGKSSLDPISKYPSQK